MIYVNYPFSLPYLEAVIAEVSRISTIAPLTAPHSTERDTQLNGFLIPKVKSVH